MFEGGAPTCEPTGGQEREVAGGSSSNGADATAAVTSSSALPDNETQLVGNDPHVTGGVRHAQDPLQLRLCLQVLWWKPAYPL
jgi:hypothetical protein